MFDAAINAFLDTHPSVQSCTWGTLSFRALVGEAVAPSAPEARGMEENEHELILTCRYADFNSDDLPAPGDSVTIGSKTYPVSVTHYVAGNGELELIVRDAQ